jgi:hypothetical protein
MTIDQMIADELAIVELTDFIEPLPELVRDMQQQTGLYQVATITALARREKCKCPNCGFSFFEKGNK